MSAHRFWVAKPYEDLAPKQLKRPRRLSGETVQRILQMRRAGKTLDEISATLGVGTAAIKRACKTHISDYERAEIRSAIQRSTTAYDNCPARLKRQQILDLRRQGLSYSRIAERLGLASASVGMICKHLGYLEEDIAANNAAGSRFKTGFDHRRNRGFKQQ